MSQEHPQHACPGAGRRHQTTPLVEGSSSWPLEATAAPRGLAPSVPGSRPSASCPPSVMCKNPAPRSQRSRGTSGGHRHHSHGQAGPQHPAPGWLMEPDHVHLRPALSTPLLQSQAHAGERRQQRPQRWGWKDQLWVPTSTARPGDPGWALGLCANQSLPTTPWQHRRRHHPHLAGGQTETQGE